jgi:hypothetical protein
VLKESLSFKKMDYIRLKIKFNTDISFHICINADEFHLIINSSYVINIVIFVSQKSVNFSL